MRSVDPQIPAPSRSRRRLLWMAAALFVVFAPGERAAGAVPHERAAPEVLRGAVFAPTFGEARPPEHMGSLVPAGDGRQPPLEPQAPLHVFVSTGILLLHLVRLSRDRRPGSSSTRHFIARAPPWAAAA